MKIKLKKQVTAVLLVTLISALGACQSNHANNPESAVSSSDPGVSSSDILPSSSSGFSVVDSLRILGDWSTFTDNPDGGLSTIQFQDSLPGPGTDRSVQANVFLSIGALPYNPSAGISLRIDADGSRFAGLTYAYKGAAHQIRVEIAEVNDYCFHYVQIPESRVWKQVNIPWSDFIQEDWGAKVTFSPNNILNLSWSIKGKDQLKDSLQLSNIAWAESSLFPTPAPDFAIRPAGGPDTVILGSLAITHPLQKKAMQYLNQGINLTNWLEENHGFTQFDYNEQTIQKIAALGFKGLRLPIDLDQYVNNKVAFLAGTEAFSLDSSLFTPLDSFQVWTARHGISFTIDYHQYDGSFTPANSQNPRYRLMMKSLWACVAKRYANLNREDLFYELANEPDVNIQASTWHSLAQEIIDTIRTVDPARPIIFGAVNWYHIPDLITNTPFSDPNIIYVFHFYEPFLYTHQGAPWEKDLASVRNIPFPYDPARWGNTYKHFGATAPWVKTLIDNYPDYGNRNSMKALLYKAKEWAVKNNVPVICNEFGTNTFQSSPEDRIAWLTTTVDLMEELEIPWQHWGYDSGNDILDGQGNLLNGIKSAFRLP